MEIDLNSIPKELGEDLNHWIYNALDCAATLEIWNELQPLRSENCNISYEFVTAMRAPALAMMRRGARIDMEARGDAIVSYRKKQDTMVKTLNALAEAVWDRPLNHNSPKQLQDFFYTVMKIPTIVSYKKGKPVISMDREVMEKLESYFYARPIARSVLILRDYDKKLQVLHKGLRQHEGHLRIHTNYNTVGTETGRWNSSESVFDDGDNLQNWTDELRRMVIPDPGNKFGNFDLEQAESRAVGYISGDRKYIEACEGYDLHTTVAKMTWPELKWSADPAENRVIAERPFYRHFSYRDMAKRGGHGTNYYGGPPTMAKHLKVPVGIMVTFQQKYFAAFPGIRKWHHKVAEQIQTKRHMVTALGRERWFHGRPYDDITLREGIAFEPQSIIAELLNLWLYRVHRDLTETTPLLQIHDAILVQYKIGIEHEIIPKILSLAKIPVKFPAGELIIPASCETGFNWGKAKKENELGLAKWKGKDERREPKRAWGILDRPLHTLL